MAVKVQTEFHCDNRGKYIVFRYGPKPATDHVRAQGWRVGRQRVLCPRSECR